MNASTLARMESELADIFRNTPTRLISNTHLAIPKKPAPLSAITHGLTGQTLILAADELPLYAKMGLEYMLECRPVGIREIGVAQLIFEGRWRLNRILAIEGNLVVVSQPREVHPTARVGNPGRARRVNAFREEAPKMDLIRRYETRIIRNGLRLSAELKELQRDRARQTPGRVFDEETNDGVNWYKRLLARSETPTSAVAETPVSTSGSDSFRPMPPRLTAQVTFITTAERHSRPLLTSESIWGQEKQAA